MYRQDGTMKMETKRNERERASEMEERKKKTEENNPRTLRMTKTPPLHVVFQLNTPLTWKILLSTLLMFVWDRVYFASCFSMSILRVLLLTNILCSLAHYSSYFFFSLYSHYTLVVCVCVFFFLGSVFHGIFFICSHSLVSKNKNELKAPTKKGQKKKFEAKKKQFLRINTIKSVLCSGWGFYVEVM